MAENAWDHYSLPPLEKKIHLKPWWKERLKRKCLSSFNHQDSKVEHLNVKSWMFMKSRLDEYRNGVSVFSGDSPVKTQGDLGPNIFRCAEQLSASARSRQQSPQDTVCLLKKPALQHVRLNEINQIETELKKHQLALYPHLEECLPSELYEEVVEILDPEMCIGSTEKDFDVVETEHDIDQQVSGVEPPPLQSHNKKIDLSKINESEAIHNQYRWISFSHTKEETRDKKWAELRKYASQNEDENIQNITTEFCNWVSSLGGESNNIEESTLTSLFASGYETKPALSVPIHVVELTSVPPELRISGNNLSHLVNIPAKLQKQQPQVSSSCSPSVVKFKYGAWYLSRRIWKVRPVNEPLCDPNEAKDKEMSEAKKKKVPTATLR